MTIKVNPVTMTKNGAFYYYYLNGHGDIIALTDESGNVAVPIVYLYLGTVLTSPDLQFDLISLQLSLAKGDYLGAAIDIASISSSKIYVF